MCNVGGVMIIRDKISNQFITTIFILFVAILSYLNDEIITPYLNNHKKLDYTVSDNFEKIPEYNGLKYIILNNNEPNFSKEELTTESFEIYSNLDYLGRCGVVFANVSKETMPTEERGSIGMIRPTGWQTTKYDGIDGKYLYNRCHLIAYQLTGENANKKNLITCTRYMNAVSMLEFENKVAEYIKSTNNHVLYRVTPVFEGENLLAKGVQMEALSVEDNGKGVKFNVFVYNVQEGIKINYSNGDNAVSE